MVAAKIMEIRCRRKRMIAVACVTPHTMQPLTHHCVSGVTLNTDIFNKPVVSLGPM